jgi:polyferredoxin
MSSGNDRTLRFTRYAVQAFFMLVTLWIGWRFYGFVAHFENPSLPQVERPPSVDAFLPIGGLMAAKYFLFTGIVEPVHPAGFFLFVGIVTSALVMKKGFCGWICPVGTISQLLWMAGEKLTRRRLVMPSRIDVPLRGVKYFLMFLFIMAIGVAMSPNMMVLFFLSDYYKTVDVLMMRFFTDMSAVTAWTLGALGALSLFYRNFWCRYLCPYGALLGLASLTSPFKIRRNDDKCVHCRACSRHCPSQLDVEKLGVISSPECYGCLTCVSRCPSAGALEITVRVNEGRKKVNPYVAPAVLVAVFYAFIVLGMAIGKWQTAIPYEEYKRVIPALRAGDSARM